jgi:NAD(P)H-dependent flavin oxidoreductase YrpB (nitropropane dioxygenase family)
MLGVEYPIVQAPTGWITCASLASAMSNAGDTEAAVALSGQVAGRIDAVKPVKQIIDETIAEFYVVMADMAGRYVPASAR